MSLLILIALFIIGIPLLSVVKFFDRSNDHVPQEIAGYAMKIFTTYLSVLSLGILACIGFGIAGWLKNGIWFTVNPIYLISKLENTNFIRELLLTHTSWVGIQEMSVWYLRQNIAWSFLLVILALLIYAFIYLNNSNDQNT